MSDESDVVQAKVIASPERPLFVFGESTTKVWEAGLAAFQYNSGLPKRRGLWHRFRYWLRRSPKA